MKKIKELKYNDTTNMGRGVSIKDIFLKTLNKSYTTMKKNQSTKNKILKIL